MSAAVPGPAFLDWLADQAASRRRAGLTRDLQPRQAPDDTSANAEGGVRAIDLASNDYLGLSTHPQVTAAAAEAAVRWGAGSGASRLVTGSLALHTDLEQELAAFCGHPAALVFSSGYLANLGAVTALAGRGDLVVLDAHVHASLMDAARLSRARVVTVDHRDLDAVADVLTRRTETRAMVVTESVFSALGDSGGPDGLAALAGICQRSGAVLLVDEAHAVGVTGPGGRGLVVAAGLAGHPEVLVSATLSKAFGSQGGVLLGHRAVREHLLSTSRAFAYDTALAPAAAAAALTALRLLAAQPQRTAVLADVASRIAAALDLPTPAGAVLALPMPGPHQALAAAERCRARGVLVSCFRPPSVPDRISRLRITAKADLGATDLERACQVLQAVR